MSGPRLSLLGGPEGPIALQCFVHISDKKNSCNTKVSKVVFNHFDRDSIIFLVGVGFSVTCLNQPAVGDPHSELLPVSIAVAPSCSSEPWPNTPSKKILNCNKLQNSYQACHGRSSSDCKANRSVFFGPSHVSLCFTNLRRSMYVMFIPANVCEKALEICHRGASLTIPLQVWASGVTVLPPGISWNIWHPKDVTWFDWSHHINGNICVQAIPRPFRSWDFTKSHLLRGFTILLKSGLSAACSARLPQGSNHPNGIKMVSKGTEMVSKSIQKVSK